jgi:hypothetical protein
MTHNIYLFPVRITQSFMRFLAASVCLAAVALADSHRKSPTSKIYVADIVGDAQIDTGTEIDDLTKKSVYNASGTAIETKDKSNASLVLSNGTGLFFDVGTRAEIRDFEQAAFRPNRSDAEEEPSLSRTHVFVDHGVIGVSTSKLVAGSVVVYDTSLASATIHGREAVIHASDTMTVISMVNGEATVQAGPLDRPHQVKNRQQAIVRPGKTPDLNIIEIIDIPDGNQDDAEQWIEERVQIAESARKLVYFEVQTRSGSGSSSSADIDLFDGASPDTGDRQIVAIPVVPGDAVNGPVVSPANLTSH